MNSHPFLPAQHAHVAVVPETFEQDSWDWIVAAGVPVLSGQIRTNVFSRTTVPDRDLLLVSDVHLNRRESDSDCCPKRNWSMRQRTATRVRLKSTETRRGREIMRGSRRTICQDVEPAFDCGQKDSQPHLPGGKCLGARTDVCARMARP